MADVITGGLLVNPTQFRTATGTGLPRYATGTNTTQEQPQYGMPMSQQMQNQLMQPQYPMANYGTTVNQNGATTTYTPAPNVATTQYQTTPTSTAAQDWSKQTGIPANQFPMPNTMTGGTVTSGQGTLSQGAYEQQQQDQLRSLLAQQAFQQRLALLQPYTGTGAAPRISMDGMSPDETAARAAAFARAKEQAGGTAASALAALKDAMASRGLTGSTGRGFESGGISDIIGSAAGGINEFSREQLLQDLNRYADIANTRYQGDITQRGQDLDAQRAILGLMSSNFNLF